MVVKKQDVKDFIAKWQGKGKEHQDDRSFWIDILQDVFELTKVTDRLEFQKAVIGSDNNTKFIDVYIPETRVLIEQKSLNIALDKPQSGHNGMTPYEQAKMYDNCLRASEKARWIVTSNFSEIWIYDMDSKRPEECIVKINLKDLDRRYKELDFLFDPQVEQITREFDISKQAGDQIGTIYEALLKQYPQEPSEDDLKNLNAFCVRLVFCYYAEDAGLFNAGLFSNYIKSFNPVHLRTGFKELFRILNTKDTDRDPFEEQTLLAFPYVNGGLFDGNNNVIPQIDESIKSILVSAADFDWSDISPTIFGAIFESTLNQETRRENGMHYTAIENIHKVIDPLFLNDLKSELEDIKASKQPNVRVQKLRAYQDKLASLTFFDPACGSGNFLTETYLSLRKLENDVIATLNIDQMEFVGELSASPIKVQLDQFYGIEINDFAVSVARTALWIAENQMMEKTKEIIVNADSLNFLPLKSFTKNIREANALQMDWKDVLPPNGCSYIMGNPPFSGTRTMKKSQKAEVVKVFGKKWNSCRSLDYVSCWYKIAAEYMQGTSIKSAFVSTNSITQGEQVPILWENLINVYGVTFDFAYRTFRWDSEANIKAKVHCVIIGFSLENNKKQKLLFDEDNNLSLVNNISPYLTDEPSVFVKRQEQPICDVPNIYLGCTFGDDGNLVMTCEEKDELIRNEPEAKQYIRPYMMGKDFIRRKPRYCLWLDGVTPAKLHSMKNVMRRVEAVRKFRLEDCDNEDTIAAADTPAIPSMLRYYMHEEHANYIAIPKVSSSRREYIPIELVDKDVVAGDKIFLMPYGDLFHFGIITSNVHMAWMRKYGGRLKSDYSYASKIVYNSFPWPNVTPEQKKEIEKNAQAIIDARALYPDSTLADLYDPVTMPIELRKAHRANDKTILEAYNFKDNISEKDMLDELMKKYQEIINKLDQNNL